MFIIVALNGKMKGWYDVVLTFSDYAKDLHACIKQEQTSDSSGEYNFEKTYGTYL